MLINVISSVIIWGLFLVCGIQILVESGLLPTLSSKLSFLGRKQVTYPTYQPTKLDFVKIFFFAAGFRILILLFSYLMLFFFNANENGYAFGNVVEQWLKWDANNYIRIATVGYEGYQTEGMYSTLVFFPLYAWLIRFFLLFIANEGIAALAASYLCFIAGCIYLFGFVSLEYGKTIAWKTIILISIFPFSFFLGGMMPESTFFFMSAACFYYIKKHKWPLAALFGFLTTLSRMQGILLIIPATIEWLAYYKPLVLLKEKKVVSFTKLFATKLLWMCLMIFGPLIYLWENYRVTGDPFKFLEYQQAIWGQHAQYFGTTIKNIWNLAMTNSCVDFTKIAIWIPELVLFSFTCIVLIYGVRKHKPQYTCFLLLYLVMNYMPSWLLSAGRYMTVALPLYFILAEFLDKKPKLWTGVVIIFSMLFTCYMWAFLCWKQVF